MPLQQPGPDEKPDEVPALGETSLPFQAMAGDLRGRSLRENRGAIFFCCSIMLLVDKVCIELNLLDCR